MLSSSKLLPLTIAGIGGILLIKTYALVTTVPSRAALRTGLEEVTSAASGFVSQAHASSNSLRAAAPTRGQAAAMADRTAAGTVAPPAPASTSAQFAELDKARPVPPTALPPPVAAAAATAETAASTPSAGIGQLPPPATAGAAGSASELPASYRDRAEEREQRLAQREATMAAAEKRLNDRLAELVVLQQRMQGLESALKERDAANWTGLVKLYEGMKPHDAAVLFNTLEKPVLLEILDRMKPAKASPVIAAMDPERARQVTADLATKRTKSATIVN